MKKLSVVGILVGGVIDVVSSAVLGVPLVIVALASHGSAHPGAPATDVVSVMHSNILLTIGEWFVGGACSIFSGYVSARIAKHDEILNGACLAWLCTVIGLLFWKVNNTPLLQHVILFVASPLLGAAGGYFFSRFKRADRPLATV
jgi:hypothetical protein